RSAAAEASEPTEATGHGEATEPAEAILPAEAPEPAEAPAPGEAPEPSEATESPEASAPGEAALPTEANPGDDDTPDDTPEDTTFTLDRSPDLTSDEALEAALEALLLVVDSPASEESLAEAVDQSVSRVAQTLRTMSERLTARGSGIDLRRVGEGWRFFTRDTYAPFVEKLLLDGQRSKLTRAALETLAVIAYRQPVTRSRVAAVRGVNVDGVIRTLLARGLIEEAGTDPETGGTLYVTTELFLERLGLASLHDLPPIAPLLPEVDAIDDI
ncbi:SMC-Scp complex subunit ScpB, partial [Amycolatopsis dongchuanensis]|uniref:SMC-Scp complex subunit ScpB n=1 Tax=Amycolatopsis dongchuanensis TaxID=1070866 RepID=UPI003D15DB3D